MTAVLLLVGLCLLAGCRQTQQKDMTTTIFPKGTASSKIATDAPADAASDTDPVADAPQKAEPAHEPAPAKAESQNGAPTAAEIADAKKRGTRTAVIKTEKGDIVAELYGKDAPLTVANFVKLAQKKFYNGLTFHRVETDKGFQLIQGGCPLGNGTGDPGYSIKLEIADNLKHVEGALAMARSQDPDSAGSQFYITNCAIAQLDGDYAVFGKVVKGLEVSKKIQEDDEIISITIK
jgi:cyclophilin family peptidyl-prolyl cis-trans isomerase